MLKRINWKLIFKSFAWLICLAGLVVLMSFISIKKQEIKCTKVEIIIPGADNFIEREEIELILTQDHGQLIGRNLNQINIHEIEQSLKSNPYIAFAKIYADMDGVIRVDVKQRQPILRILNAGGQDFYIDTDGLKMPMSPNFTAKVLVATGNILEGFGGKVDTLFTPLAIDLYKTALHFKKDTLWDAQIEQIFVNQKNDIELIPRVGNQRIILGNAERLETKMTNLLAFYKQAMPKVGWNAYKTINLKYINQIVCEKNDSLSVKKINRQLILDTSINAKGNVDSVIKVAIKEELKVNKVVDRESLPVKDAGAASKYKLIVKPTLKTVEKPSEKSTKILTEKTTLVDKKVIKSVDQKKEKATTKKNN